MKIRKFHTLFLFLTLFSLNKLYTQEKRSFLQHRYDGFTEVINKDYSKEKLTFLKNDFARVGIDFSYFKLKINKKKEIIKISLKIKNKKSSASLFLNETKSPIPSIEIGENNGIVFIKPVSKYTQTTSRKN